MLLLSSTAGFSCLATDMLGGRRQGDDFSLSLHTLCKGLWKFLFFIFLFLFCIVLPKGLQEKPSLWRKPRGKSACPGSCLRALCLMSDLWVMDPASSQFCASHWDFLQPQILTPGRTEMTYSRLTTVTLHHVWPSPEQSLCNPQPLCVPAIRILLLDTAPAEKNWAKDLGQTFPAHLRRAQKIRENLPQFLLVVKIFDICWKVF